MKIRKLTNEEIKGACAFAVSIYNIAIRGCFRTQDSHRYFDEYMDADRLTDEERTGVLVVFGAFDSNVLCFWSESGYMHACSLSSCRYL